MVTFLVAFDVWTSTWTTSYRGADCDCRGRRDRRTELPLDVDLQPN